MNKKLKIKDLLEFGIINIDKPSGPTSFQVAEIVGKMLNARKFSHFGTLDPKVTGVLPIALNRACKLTGWFMKKNKTYVGIMKLHKELPENDIKKEMKKFVGKIMQKPPVKSRVKRELRQREVFSWKILEFDKKKKEVLFEAEVEAGTYIRKLISDLGEKIGGAHMTELRRTKAGIFEEKDSINLYELERIAEKNKFINKKQTISGADRGIKKIEEVIIPAEQAVKKIIPSIEIKPDNLRKILTGKPIMKEDLIKKGKIKDVVAVFCKKRFVGIYKLADEGDIILKAEFVFN